MLVYPSQKNVAVACQSAELSDHPVHNAKWSTYGECWRGAGKYMETRVLENLGEPGMSTLPVFGYMKIEEAQPTAHVWNLGVRERLESVPQFLKAQDRWEEVL
jgi:hypothetical protein